MYLSYALLIGSQHSSTDRDFGYNERIVVITHYIHYADHNIYLYQTHAMLSFVTAMLQSTKGLDFPGSIRKPPKNRPLRS